MKVNMCFESSADFFHLSLTEDSEFCMEFESSAAPISGETYGGPYVVCPELEEQRLHTASKFCTADVRVLEIPYFEVGNTSGKTAIIGGKKNG
ncbi:MAG: hypothetical protein SOY73_13110 [Blautia sp.]|nr:hypothetical protein [Blautia sp.]